MLFKTFLPQVIPNYLTLSYLKQFLAIFGYYKLFHLKLFIIILN
jgi:hypothetical protein